MPSLYFSIQSIITSIIFIVGLFVHWSIAWFIYVDAQKYERSHNRQVEVLPAWLWSLSSGVFGLVAFSVYWVIHYTSIGRKPTNE